jgi:cytolysin-activating lysine-acyltransferase
MSKRGVDNDGEAALSPEAIEQAKAALSKLPVLGPIIWLYGRDASRRYRFIADLDQVVLPPVLLDQCKIYFNTGVPWGYVSWANVSDLVHQRLQSGIGTLAPHEWNSGGNHWIIDVVTPFGGAPELVEEVRSTALRGMLVYRLESEASASRFEALQPRGTPVQPTTH